MATLRKSREGRAMNFAECEVDLFEKAIPYFFRNPERRVYDVTLQRNPETEVVTVTVQLSEQLTITSTFDLTAPWVPMIETDLKRQIQNILDPGLIAPYIKQRSEPFMDEEGNVWTADREGNLWPAGNEPEKTQSAEVH
jgi:hypothetical protein